MAVRNYLSNSVSILLGNGEGKFGTALNSATGNVPYREVASDFNVDGKLDLAVTNYNDNTVSILLGNGDGTFQAHQDYPAGPSPVGAVTGDFKGDGKLDLAVANESGNTVSILLGNGNGKFRPHVDYAVGAGPFMVATADIDADGKLDLAIANSGDGTVSILRGNGDGTFGVANNFAAGNAPLNVVLADFNRDGRPDLAVATINDDAVTVMLETATVSVLPSSLNFGGQVLGITSAAKSVTLTNVGGTTLTISGIAIAGTNATDFTESSTCGSSLASKAHRTISLTLTPSQLGPETASLTVTDSAQGGPQSVPLSGIGVTYGPNATLSTTSLTFAMQLVGTHSPAQTFTLGNFGTSTLTINSTNLTAPIPATLHRSTFAEAQ